jgi:hypothetical protein
MAGANRRVVMVTLLVFCTAVAARVAAAPSRPVHVSSPAIATCGVERWTVKTLQDRPSLFPARPTTVAHLVSLPRPLSLPYRRLRFERHIFTVTAAVTLHRLEDDLDFHLVIHSGPNHMIAETPSSLCTRRATPLRRLQMQKARRAARLCRLARVTGVAFFDFYHGQTGVAPNAIELHRVLAFRCLKRSAAAPPKTTTTPRAKCASSYPDVCIPPPPPDLDCDDIRYRNFRVLWNVPDPDPHHFDSNRDGIGCQTSPNERRLSGSSRRGGTIELGSTVYPARHLCGVDSDRRARRSTAPRDGLRLRLNEFDPRCGAGSSGATKELAAEGVAPGWVRRGLLWVRVWIRRPG